MIRFAVFILILLPFFYEGLYSRDTLEIGGLRAFYEVTEDTDSYDDIWILTADIDFAECDSVFGPSGFTPAGKFSGDFIPFTGHFDGRGHQLKNIRIDMAGADYGGLFAKIEDAVIENLIICDIEIVSGDAKIGGLAGYAIESTIDECRISGKIEGNYDVGSFVGDIRNSEIRESRSICNITAVEDAGGLAGNSESTNIKESSFSGSIVGRSDIGGIIGRSDRDNVLDCLMQGAISSEGRGGLFIGYAENSEVSYSVASGAAEFSETAGLVLGTAVGSTCENCIVDISTVRPEKSDYGHFPGVRYLTYDEARKRENYTGFSIGPIWRIKEGESRLFFTKSDISLSCGPYDGRGIMGVFASLSALSQESMITEFGIVVSENVDLSNPVIIPVESDIKPNNTFFREMINIAGLEEGRKYTASTYAVGNSGTGYYGNRIRFIASKNSGISPQYPDIVVKTEAGNIAVRFPARIVGRVQVTDYTGRTVFSKQILPGETECDIDSESFTSGLYFLIVHDDAGRVIFVEKAVFD